MSERSPSDCLLSSRKTTSSMSKDDRSPYPFREIRDLKHRQRNARRRRSQPKEDWVEGFVLGGKKESKQCVVLRRRRLLVLRLVALAMAFKNVRNLHLINHNDGFIDDDEFVLCTTSLYRKTSTCRKIRTRLVKIYTLNDSFKLAQCDM